MIMRTRRDITGYDYYFSDEEMDSEVKLELVIPKGEAYRVEKLVPPVMKSETGDRGFFDANLHRVNRDEEDQIPDDCLGCFEWFAPEIKFEVLS